MGTKAVVGCGAGDAWGVCCQGWRVGPRGLSTFLWVPPSAHPGGVPPPVVGGAGGVQPGAQKMRGAPRVRWRWNHAQYCLPGSAPLPLAGGEGSLWEFSHCRMNSFNKYF